MLSSFTPFTYFLESNKLQFRHSTPRRASTPKEGRDQGGVVPGD